jgi:hypothetical protein
MKNFLSKVSLFILPFFILFSITSILYSESESPDLLRLGYIPNVYKNYSYDISFPKIEKYVKLSESKSKKYKILTIGDSFSEQGTLGYKNFLAQDSELLHIDQYISENPIQTLFKLTKGDFFKHYKIQYVILQNVERHLIDNIETIDTTSCLNVKQLDSLISNHKHSKATSKYEFFSRTTVEFPLYYLPRYLLCENFLSNEQVYNYKLNKNDLFSNNADDLLFFNLDVVKTIKNNDLTNCQRLNALLNKLSAELNENNIKLIFLPAPDKYDFYYSFIEEKKKMPEPLFFELFKNLKKEYLYIDAKSVLQSHISVNKDLYYYDDTHWSPIAAKIIAEKIEATIR